MNKTKNLKEIIRQKYGQLASQDKGVHSTSCCTTADCGTDICNSMAVDYSSMEEYNPDADLGLGCGLPTQFAKIKKGYTVVDLGSGAGNDCFIARAETGEDGKVIGIDFTPEMIDRARENAQSAGFFNVEFRQGDIENLPLSSNLADVVISNCVLNLVPDKKNVFKEIYRVLKPGGHFSISDIVLKGNLPVHLQRNAEMYAGCISGAIQKENYLKLIRENGFNNIFIQKEKQIIIPGDILKKSLTGIEINKFLSGDFGIYSITVFAEKPKTCCGSECCN